MKNEYHQKHKERLQTEARKKNITIFLKKKKKKGEKRPKTDINNLLKKKKKKNGSIIVNLIKIFLRNKSRS